MLAAQNGHTDCLKALFGLEDIQANLQDNSGRTALMKAAQFGKTECLNFLLQKV